MLARGNIMWMTIKSGQWRSAILYVIIKLSTNQVSKLCILWNYLNQRLNGRISSGNSTCYSFCFVFLQNKTHLTTTGSSTPSCLIILGVHGPAVTMTVFAVKSPQVVFTLALSPGMISVTLWKSFKLPPESTNSFYWQWRKTMEWHVHGFIQRWYETYHHTPPHSTPQASCHLFCISVHFLQYNH